MRFDRHSVLVHRKHILRALLKMSLYDFQNEESHDSGTFKVLDLPPTTSF